MSMQVTKVWWDGEKLMAEPIPESEIYKESAQQDPVAVVASHPERIDWLRDEPPDGTLLYTTPPPCPTCEALARTVMLDQTLHDAHCKPTDEMVVAAARVLSDRQAAACNVDCGDMWKLHGNDFIDDARAALEAVNGIREKNA